MLYTSQKGNIKLRVFNQLLQVSDQAYNIFSSSDIDATINLMTKINLSNLMKNSINATRTKLISNLVAILNFYRNKVSTNHSVSQFVIPETLK